MLINIKIQNCKEKLRKFDDQSRKSNVQFMTRKMILENNLRKVFRTEGHGIDLKGSSESPRSTNKRVISPKHILVKFQNIRDKL